MLRCVLDANSHILCLSSRDDVEALCAKLNLHWVRYLGNILHSVRSNILLGVAREAVNHCEVALLHAFGRYGKVTLWLVRLVILRVVGRLVVLASIYAED